MRQVARKGLITVAAASGVLAVTGGHAYADAGANGGAAGSPGVLSGNTVQVPVDVPVNLCGNSVNVIGALNPAAGNLCANASHHDGHGGQHQDGGAEHGGGAQANGGAAGSAGVASGNTVQVPVHVPVNACGNSVDVIGLGNPAVGNACGNDSDARPPRHHEPEQPPSKPGHPSQPPGHHTPGEHPKPPTPGDHTPQPPQHHQPAHETPAPPQRAHATQPAAAKDNTPSTATVGTEQLAQTGAGGMAAVVPVSAGLLVAGAVIYRRSRVAARR